MKRTFVPFVMVAMVAFSGPSWAWSHVSGSINSIDPNARQLTLDNGTTYTLQPSVKLNNLAVGDKVTVNTETTNAGTHLVNKVTKSN